MCRGGVAVTAPGFQDSWELTQVRPTAAANGPNGLRSTSISRIAVAFQWHSVGATVAVAVGHCANAAHHFTDHSGPVTVDRPLSAALTAWVVGPFRPITEPPSSPHANPEGAAAR